MRRVLNAFACAILLLLGLATAQAGAAAFHTNWASTGISGAHTTDHVMTTPAGVVTCKGASLSGSGYSEVMGYVTLTPTYNNCKLKAKFKEIEVEADFSTSGCTYTFWASGTLEILCLGGTSAATFSGPGCTISIPSQNVKTVTYANHNTGTKEITFASNLSAITSWAAGSSCSTVGESKNGTLTGSYTVRATKFFIGTHFWWE